MANVGVHNHSNFPAKADNKGYGYGVVDPTGFNEPYAHGTEFPYMEPDEYEDLDDEVEDLLDPDVKRKLKSKTLGHIQQVDSFPKGNYIYFSRNSMMEAPAVAKNSIVPFPSIYDSRDSVSGGYTQQKAYDGRPYKRTGTEQGWASRPPESVPGSEFFEEYEAAHLEDIPTDDERTLIKLRMLINAIHAEEKNVR